MSRIGSLKIDISGLKNCTYSEEESKITIENNGHTVQVPVPPFLKITMEDKKISVEFQESYFKSNRLIRINYPMWGTFVRTLQTKVLGLTKGFTKKLIITGTGYRVEQNGEKLVFKLGFSHMKEMILPKEITAEIKAVQNSIELFLKSHDKCLLGDYTHSVCNLRRPNGYSDKGIRDVQKVLIIKEVNKK